MLRQGPLTLPCVHRDRHAREAQEHALSQELMQQAPCEHVLKRRTGLWWVGTASWRNRTDIENCEAETRTRISPGEPKFGRLLSLRDRESPRWLPVVSRLFLETACCLKRPDWLAGVAGFEPLHQDSCPIVPAAIVQREGWQQLVRRNSGSGTGPEGRDSSPCPGRPDLDRARTRSGEYLR